MHYLRDVDAPRLSHLELSMQRSIAIGCIVLTASLSSRLDGQQRHTSGVSISTLGNRTLSTTFTPRAPSLDATRGRALLGAAVGGVAGAVVGYRAPCRSRDEQRMCEIDGALIGLGTGLLIGNTVGAFAGTSGTACGPTSRFAHSAAGAVLGSIPFAAYLLATRSNTRKGEVVFSLAVTLPLLQAEGASRVARSC